MELSVVCAKYIGGTIFNWRQLTSYGPTAPHTEAFREDDLHFEDPADYTRPETLAPAPAAVPMMPPPMFLPRPDHVETVAPVPLQYPCL